MRIGEAREGFGGLLLEEVGLCELRSMSLLHTHTYIVEFLQVTLVRRLEAHHVIFLLIHPAGS